MTLAVLNPAASFRTYSLGEAVTFTADVANNDASFAVNNLSVTVRFAIFGGSAFLILGACVGLVVGLFVNPPTAVFALLEGGIPSGIVGAIAGFLAGVVVSLLRRRAN